jgi:hypothetical protein
MPLNGLSPRWINPYRGFELMKIARADASHARSDRNRMRRRVAAKLTVTGGASAPIVSHHVIGGENPAKTGQNA